jgi:UDP-glucose 4-epimerase
MLKILVVGGAGFIGSHMVKMLGQRGCQVTTLDDLSSGHRDAVLCGEGTCQNAISSPWFVNLFVEVRHTKQA